METTDKDKSLRRMAAAGGWLDIALACSCLAFIVAAMIYLATGNVSIASDGIGEAIGMTFALLIVYVFLFIFFLFLLIAAAASAFVGIRSVKTAKRGFERKPALASFKRYCICQAVLALLFAAGAAVFLSGLLPAALVVMLAVETGLFIGCAAASVALKGILLHRLKAAGIPQEAPCGQDGCPLPEKEEEDRGEGERNG